MNLKLERDKYELRMNDELAIAYNCRVNGNDAGVKAAEIRREFYCYYIEKYDKLIKESEVRSTYAK